MRRLPPITFFSAFIFLLFSFVFHFGCGNPSSNSKNAAQGEEENIQEQTFSRPPNAEEIQNSGFLRSVEDFGYPIAYLEIEFPNNDTSEFFEVNFEEIDGIDLQSAYKNVDKQVQFYYIKKKEKQLVELTSEGKSLFEEFTLPIKPEWEKVEGMLGGAEEETPGDLPGRITVTSKEDSIYAFEVFVTPEMVAANGQQIMAYYQMGNKNSISYFRFAK